MTLPTSSSWFPQGKRLQVPYEASQGRRVNAIGAHFTHGPQAGRFEYRTWACLPKSRAKKRRKSPEELAAAHGLQPDEVGPIDSERFVAFLWQIAGRGPDAPEDWTRERELIVILDNYSVHKSRVVAQARPLLAAAGVHLLYLPAYAPELSAIEPDWNDLKRHLIPVRSFQQLDRLKRAVDDGLARKADFIRLAHANSTNSHRLDT
jgi:hypothetical protein